MIKIVKQSDWKAGSLWTLATMLCFLAVGNGQPLWGALLLGTVQWFALRRHIPAASRWLIASFIGFNIGGGIVWPAFGVGVQSAANLMFWLGVIGFATGISQWLIFRRHILHANWWLLANVIGFTLGGAVMAGVGGLVYQASGAAVGKSIVFGIGGIVSGAITGGAAIYLLRQLLPEREATSFGILDALGAGFEWRFWILGLLPSGLGYILSLGVLSEDLGAIGTSGSDLVFETLVTTIVAALFGAMVGAFIGLVQWLVLRTQIREAGWWVLATAAGLALGLAGAIVLKYLLGLEISKTPAWVFSGATVGALVGLAQWRFLRRHLLRSGWWVLASTLGFGIAFIFSSPPPHTFDASSGSGALGLFGIYLGAMITISTLIWLFHQPSSTSEDAFE